MPSDLDQKMDTVLPGLKNRLEEVTKQEPRWRSLFDVFKGAMADPSAGRVRVRDVTVARLAIARLPKWVSVTEVKATPVGSRTVKTALPLDWAKLETFQPATSADVDKWAVRSAQSAALVLGHAVAAAFAGAPVRRPVTAATLPEVIGEEWPNLGRLTLDLVVSPAMLSRVGGKVGEKVKAALNGGAIVPLSRLTAGRAWLLPHHGDQVVVETVEPPNVRWEAVHGGVSVFTREEFIVVSRRPLPVRHLDIT